MDMIVEKNPINNNISFGEGSKYIIRSNMNPMLDIILEEVNDFTLQAGLKMKSIGVLYQIVKGCGSSVVSHLEKILFALYKNINNDEEDIMAKIEETANILGLCIDQDIIIPILSKHLSDVEIKTAFQPFSARVRIFSNVVMKIANITAKTAKNIIDIINELDIFNLPESIYNKDILINCYKIYDSLIINLHSNRISKEFHTDLFIPLLFLQSIPETALIHKRVKDETMLSLCVYCGFDSIESLYSFEMVTILDKFKTSHKLWRRNSPDRFAFDSLVKNAGIALENSWKEVLTIISNSIEVEKDLEMRVDMMVLMEKIIDTKILSDDARMFAPFMIREILIPGTYWKNNRPSYKIRQVALVCLIKMFDNQLVDLDMFNDGNDIIVEFFTVLKVTLADDWDANLRFLSIVLVGRVFTYCEKMITEFHLSDSYNMILKRMDDAQDKIRIESCNVLKTFFRICMKGIKVSESQFKFIIETLFVHFDDSKEEIRIAVKEVLKYASQVYSKKFLEIAEDNLKRFTHQSICKEVIEYASQFVNKYND